MSPTRFFFKATRSPFANVTRLTTAWLAGLVFTLAFSLATRADEGFNFLPLTGRVFSDVYLPTQPTASGRVFNQLSTSLWLESDPKVSDNTAARLIYQGDAIDGNNSVLTGSSSVTHLESNLREGYVSTQKPGYDFRIGKQIIPWGKSDVFNPTDFNTAKNLAFFNPDDEVRRIGSYSAVLTVTPLEGSFPFSFTTIWTPLFAQSKLLFPPAAIPPGSTIADPVAPPLTLANGEIAEKVAYTGNGWDTSASFFSGWDHMPELQEVNYTVVGPAVLVNLAQVFERITAFGLDGSYSTEKWVFRGEAAYSITPNDSGASALILPSHFDAVIGAERPLGDLFRVQGQLVIRYFPHYTSPSQATGPDPISTGVNQAVANANALLVQYTDPSRPAATLRFSYLNEKTGVDGEIFYLQNFAGGDFLLRPKAGYAATDFLRLSTGVEFYQGPSNRPLGALNPFSSYFFEAKYTF